MPPQKCHSQPAPRTIQTQQKNTDATSQAIDIARNYNGAPGNTHRDSISKRLSPWHQCRTPRPIPLSFVITLLFTLVCCTGPAWAADQPTWLEIHSAHFTVITDAGDKRGPRGCSPLRADAICICQPVDERSPQSARPLTILAFNNDKNYYQLAPLHQGQPVDVPGFLLTGEDQDFIVLNLSEAEPWRAVAHDFAHMLLNENYPPAQGWFDEGLAEYFASLRVDNKQAEIGGDPQLRPAAANSSQSFIELLNTQPWLSLPELFMTKHDASADAANSRSNLFYAESWIVMHYLLHEKKLPETGAYFNLALNQHASAEDAIQKAYSTTATQMQQAVKDYFHSKSAPDPAHPADASAALSLTSPLPSAPTTWQSRRSLYPRPTNKRSTLRLRSEFRNGAIPA